MAMDCKVAVVTVNVSELEVIPLCAAVTLVEPLATPLARPPEPIVATAGLEEVHVAELVRFCVLPSLKVPLAVN